jgi:hypothetical protein
VFGDFGVVLLHGFIIAKDGFCHFLFEISEEPFNDSNHLGFSLSYFFLEALLLLCPEGLMILYFFAAVIQFLHCFLEDAIHVPYDLMDAE